MLEESLGRRLCMLFVLSFGCSAESAQPTASGGSPSTASGGSTFASGGALVTGNGGSTTTPASGGTPTGTGGSGLTPASGGATGSTLGGTTPIGSGGTTPISGGSTSVGSGGAPAAVGGSPAAAGGSTAGAAAAGGSSAGAGGAPAASGCATGCAQLSVPFTAYESSQSFEIYLDAAVDLSAATISVRVRKVSGKAGGLQLIVKDGALQNYAWAQSSWNALSTMTADFTTITFAVATPTSRDMVNTFDPAQVRILTVQLHAGAPWYTDASNTVQDPTALINPSVVQIDEISLSGVAAAPGPWTFATEVMALNVLSDAAALAAVPPYAVTGSSVTWVGP